MQNIKLTLQYDGTRYLGWKRPEKDHNDRTCLLYTSDAADEL